MITKANKELGMKTITAIFLIFINTTSFAQSSIELDQIDLSGNFSRKQMENKLESRRRKLEDQTMKKLLKKMEIERIKNELRLSQQFENALEKSVSNTDIE